MENGMSDGRVTQDSLRSVLDRTVGVLHQAEHLLFRRTRVRWKKAEVILDSIWHGPSFVLAGLEVQARLLVVGTVLAVVWWGVLYAISWVTDRVSGGWSSMIWTAVVMATASLVVRMPSAGALHGIRRMAVLLLAAYIRETCPNEGIMAAVKANLLSLAQVSEKHAGRIQTFLGLYWAALVWWVATWVLPISVPQVTRNNASGWGLLGTLFFVAAGVASIGYATASRMLWKTIALAISEVEAGTVQVGFPLPDGVELTAQHLRKGD